MAKPCRRPGRGYALHPWRLTSATKVRVRQGQGGTWGGRLRAILFMPLDMADDDDVGKRGRGERERSREGGRVTKKKKGAVTARRREEKVC